MSDNYGIPAFIPVQTETPSPVAITGTVVDTCVDEKLRVLASSTSDNNVVVTTYARDTGYQLDQTTFTLGSAVISLFAVPCGTVPMLVWLRVDHRLEWSAWNGNGWSAKSAISTVARAVDVTAKPAGCLVLWADNVSPSTLKLGEFVDGATSSSHFSFPKSLDTGAYTTHRSVTVGASPNGEIAVAWVGADEGDGTSILLSAVYTVNAVLTSSAVLAVGTLVLYPTGGLALTYRGLRNSEGHVPYVVYASIESTAYTKVFEVVSTDTARTGFVIFVRRSTTWYRMALDTKAFRVGDEVFVWMRGYNSGTRVLMGGVTNAQRCGIADQEEAPAKTHADANLVALSSVCADPLASDHTWLWARMVSISPYNIPGNARTGSMDFLPKLSSARYGKSIYIAGSMVRCWDGFELGDAGFHDYPKVASVTPSAAGGVLPTGTYLLRVYAVRHNKQGESFRSVIVTDTAAVTGPTGSIALSINPVTLTNHDDVSLEVFMTQADGSTYYFNQAVANDRNASTVAVTITGNETLGDVDPRGPSAGQEIEESGPTGCAIITAAGDRLWCVGGQVPAGTAVFSKLIEPNEGAGFDAVAGFVVLDAEGAKVNSIVGFGDSTVVALMERKVAVINGTGPSNLVGDAGFAAPRLSVADGAINHEGTVALPIGIAYWGITGPRLMQLNDRVEPICEPVLSLTAGMTPTGVRADVAKQEVVWYTAEGPAVLWSYAGQNSRWARWTGLPIAGVSRRYLVTTDGRLLQQASTPRDDGRRFEFKLGTGIISPEQLLQDYTKIRRIGLAGQYLGPHKVRIAVYFDGSPLWSERYRWEPTVDTWLVEGSTFADLTPAQIDALAPVDKSGGYATHHRTERQTCKYLKVTISDCGDQGFVPWELSFELGQKPGMSRTAINTFTK